MKNAVIILRKMEMFSAGIKAAREMVSQGMQVYLLVISEALVSAPLSMDSFGMEHSAPVGKQPDETVFGFHRQPVGFMAELLRTAEVVIPF